MYITLEKTGDLQTQPWGCDLIELYILQKRFTKVFSSA